MNDNVLVYGGVYMDKYYVVKDFPVRGEDVLAESYRELVGGCAINMAVTLMNLGAKAKVVSYMGSDGTADSIEKYMLAFGMDMSCVRRMDGPSGHCVTIVDKGGERTFITAEGCEGRFDTLLTEREASPKMILVTGYYLQRNRFDEEILASIESYKANGAAVLFDPGPLALYIRPRILKRIIGISDVITPNVNEADMIKKGLNDDNWIENICVNRTVIVKNGSKGGTAYTPAGHVVYTASNVQTVDSTGAGDSFIAGFAYGSLKELPLDEKLELGAKCAALTSTVMAPHTRFDIDDLERIK